MTPRERRVRLAIRLLTRRLAGTPEVYPTAGSAQGATPNDDAGSLVRPTITTPARGCTPARHGRPRLKGHS